jgi:hypothetical protein
MPRQLSAIGRRVKTRQLLAADLDECLAITLVGPPKVGKSYTLGVFAENAVLSVPGLTDLSSPLCVLSLNYGSGHREPELLAGVSPNRNPQDVERLIKQYRVLPVGFPDTLLLTLADHVPSAKRLHPYSQVEPIRFSCQDLQLYGMRALFGVADLGPREPFYMTEVDLVIQELWRKGCLRFDQLERALRDHEFNSPMAKEYVLRRLERARPFIDDSRSLRSFIKPGRVIVVDIRDTWLKSELAMQIFHLLVEVLVIRPAEDGASRPCNISVIYDEADLFFKHKPNARQMLNLVQRRRHFGCNVLAATQHPKSLGSEFMSHMDAMALYQTSSPELSRQMGKAMDLFGKLTPALTRGLQTSYYWLFAREWSVFDEPATFDDNLILVEQRPRLTAHGGESQRATRQEQAEDPEVPRIVYR